MDPQALQALDVQGYTLLPGALDRATLAQLRLAFDAAPASGGTQHVRLDEETPAREAWARLREHPAALAAARHLLGPAFRVRDLHGRNPLPGFGQQGLHADWPERAPGDSFFVLTALWMLDDFTAENGATRVVPGSHLQRRPLTRALAQPLSRHPNERVITGAAGSVLLLNGHLWHSARQNQSAGPRRTAQMVVQRA